MHRALPGTTYAQAMRLADTPVPARAGGDADHPSTDSGGPAPGGVGQAGAGPAAGTVPDSTAPSASTAPAFAVAVAALEAGRDAVIRVRDDLDFEDWPAPKRLAPHA